MQRASAWVTYAAFAIALAGCGTVTDSHDKEAVNSIVFDDVPCAELIRERNRLADAGGVPRDAKYLPEGEGALSFDFRSAKERDKARATARVAAMNHSLVRRACER